MISHKHSLGFLFAAIVTCLCLASAEADPRNGEQVIVPGAVVMPDGSLATDTAVVLQGGEIVRVESADAYEGVDDETVMRRPGAVLSPGLIDVLSTLGVTGQNVERTDPIDPSLRVVEAFDEYDRRFAAVLRGGVTAAVLVPGNNNVVGGSAAVIRTSSPDGRPRVIREDGPLIFSLGPPTFRSGHAPTSRAGALAMAREALTAARDGRGDERLQAVLAGDLDFLVFAHRGEDVTAAYRLFDSYGLGAVVVHSHDLLEVAEDVLDATMPVVVGPYDAGSPVEEMAAPAAVQNAGGEIVIAGRTPQRSADALRLSAGLAVRYGMDSDAARQAITVNAADVAGVGDRIGRIQDGYDADLVLFSADPLRMDARVLEVYVEGMRVYRDEHIAQYLARNNGAFSADVEEGDTGGGDDE